jgi:hypothetical protein
MQLDPIAIRSLTKDIGAVRHFDKTILHLRRESGVEGYKRTKGNAPKRSEKSK